MTERHAPTDETAPQHRSREPPPKMKPAELAPGSTRRSSSPRRCPRRCTGSRPTRCSSAAAPSSPRRCGPSGWRRWCRGAACASSRRSRSRSATAKSTVKAIEATSTIKDGADEIEVVAHVPAHPRARRRRRAGRADGDRAGRAGDAQGRGHPRDLRVRAADGAAARPPRAPPSRPPAAPSARAGATGC